MLEKRQIREEKDESEKKEITLQLPTVDEDASPLGEGEE
jgi:hypothetical protein